MADLKTNLLGFTMNSPIIGASGTVGYGVEYEELADFSRIGGISGKGQTLPHGGAGAVQPEEGNAEVPQAEGGADALVQQVPGQDVVQFRRGQPALFQGPGQGLLLHGGLRLLPGVLSEEGIRAQQVKMPRQGAVGLEFSADVGIGHHAGGPQQGHRLPAQASGRHKNHLLSIVCRTRV